VRSLAELERAGSELLALGEPAEPKCKHGLCDARLPQLDGLSELVRDLAHRSEIGVCATTISDKDLDHEPVHVTVDHPLFVADPLCDLAQLVA
jgi:hypothetical protein